MTTDEKLKHFEYASVSDSIARADKMFSDYKDALEKTFEEHKADAERRQKMEIRLESEKIQREGNKQLSIAHIDLRKSIGKKQEELKDMLFVELKDKLANFLETPAYHDLLEKEIREALDFADGTKITFFLDPADEDKIQRLSLHHGADIQVSPVSFIGGIRAVIPEKNVLIDNSFKTKIEEAEQNFHFETEGSQNE